AVHYLVGVAEKLPLLADVDVALGDHLLVGLVHFLAVLVLLALGGREHVEPVLGLQVDGPDRDLALPDVHRDVRRLGRQVNGAAGTLVQNLARFRKALAIIFPPKWTMVSFISSSGPSSPFLRGGVSFFGATSFFGPSFTGVFSATASFGPGCQIRVMPGWMLVATAVMSCRVFSFGS